MEYAIDVSHHNSPKWDLIAPTCNYCICRATYGTMRDKKVDQHMVAARSRGIQVGLYHFLRPSQPAAQQLAVFRQVARDSGYRVGDVVPALDIEADPFPKLTNVSPAWQESVKLMVDAFVSDFGDCLIYLTQREFNMLGAPAWLLERPLWPAHYTTALKPATPGNKPWTMWQHRVAAYKADGPGGYDKKNPELDQNRVAQKLPLVTKVPWDKEAITEVAEIEQDDDGWDQACVEAIAAQFDVLDIIHDEAMDELKEA